MKQRIFCLALLCPTLMFAQNKPLTIGDTLPPVVWNYLKAQAPAQLAQNKEQFIILDFWATWCPACIKETMPLDTLWRRFQNNLSVIMVAAEPKETVMRFLTSRKTLKGLSLPFITGDRLLRQFFPYRYLPHQVWIAPGGKIQAITPGGLVNDSILHTWFAGNKPNLRLKTDPPPYDASQPMFINTNGHDSAALLYRSQWAGRLLGRGGSSGKRKINGYLKYHFINRPALSLYKSVLGFRSNHVIIENINPADVILYPTSTEDEKNNLLYTYELTVPEHTEQEKINHLMLTDLNRYLGWQGRMEKRTIQCLALRSSANTMQLLAQFPDANKIPDKTLYWQCLMKPVTYLINALNESNYDGTGLPVIVDETGIRSNINLLLSYKAMDDLQQLKIELQNYGMQLVEVEREVEMFVLSKK